MQYAHTIIQVTEVTYQQRAMLVVGKHHDRSIVEHECLLSIYKRLQGTEEQKIHNHTTCNTSA